VKSNRRDLFWLCLIYCLQISFLHFDVLHGSIHRASRCRGRSLPRSCDAERCVKSGKLRVKLSGVNLFCAFNRFSTFSSVRFPRPLSATRDNRKVNFTTSQHQNTARKRHSFLSHTQSHYFKLHSTYRHWVYLFHTGFWPTKI